SSAVFSHPAPPPPPPLFPYTTLFRSQAVRRDSQLATSVDTENAHHTERPQHDMALQQGTVVTEEEVVRAADRDAQPAVRRQTIINRLDVGLDRTALRVGRAAVLAQEKHEWPRDAVSNDAP